MEELKKEFEYYISHQEELVKQYKGKVLVIKNQQVINAYDDEFTAIQETSKTHPLGTFLVQRCEPGRQSYTHTFHSRVAVG